MFDLQQAGIVVLEWREVKSDARSQTLGVERFWSQGRAAGALFGVCFPSMELLLWAASKEPYEAIAACDLE
jgi:hypothetical protein